MTRARRLAGIERIHAQRRKMKTRKLPWSTLTEAQRDIVRGLLKATHVLMRRDRHA